MCWWQLSSNILIMLSAAEVTKHSELVGKNLKRPWTALAVLRNFGKPEWPWKMLASSEFYLPIPILSVRENLCNKCTSYFLRFSPSRLGTDFLSPLSSTLVHGEFLVLAPNRSPLNFWVGRNLNCLFFIGNTVYSFVQYFSSVAENFTSGEKKDSAFMESWGSALSRVRSQLLTLF